MQTATNNFVSVQEVLDRLQQVKPCTIKQTGQSQWKARCPAPDHEDKNPSLDVSVGNDGTILFDCKSRRCSFGAICEGLGFSPSAMFGNNTKKFSSIIGVYDYRGEDGQLLFQVCRTENKEFPARKPDGSWGIKGIKRIPYRLPELLTVDNKQIIFIPEGEKDCDSLAKLGLIATCNPGGAGKWRAEYNQYLKGRWVVVLSDNDTPGREHAEQVAKSLVGIAKEVRIVQLDNLPDGGDITDWLATGGTLEGLRLRVKEAKPFVPADSIEEPAKIHQSIQIKDDNIKPEPVLVNLDSIEPQKVEWLWDNKIPMGKLSLFVGDPGLGKSFLTLYLAAQVTTGRPWPDDSLKQPILKGSVIILTAEDDINDTVLPRLISHEADVSRIVAIQGITYPDSELEGQFYFDLTTHLPALEEAILKTPETRLIIIDPITAYLGKTDSHKNAEVRGCLGPLTALAAKHKVAIIGVTHLTKNTTVKSVYRVLGSVGFIAAARAVWVIAKDKDNETRRLFLPCKTNLSIDPTSLAFSIINGAVAFEAEQIQITSDQALAPESEDERTALDDAKEFLKECLKDGPVPSPDVYKQATQNKINDRTLRRAKKTLKVQSQKTESGTGWEMNLSEGVPFE